MTPAKPQGLIDRRNPKLLRILSSQSTIVEPKGFQATVSGCSTNICLGAPTVDQYTSASFLKLGGTLRRRPSRHSIGERMFSADGDLQGFPIGMGLRGDADAASGLCRSLSRRASSAPDGCVPQDGRGAWPAARRPRPRGQIRQHWLRLGWPPSQPLGRPLRQPPSQRQLPSQPLRQPPGQPKHRSQHLRCRSRAALPPVPPILDFRPVSSSASCSATAASMRAFISAITSSRSLRHLSQWCGRSRAEPSSEPSCTPLSKNTQYRCHSKPFTILIFPPVRSGTPGRS